jgi:hypothetical protein
LNFWGIYTSFYIFVKLGLISGILKNSETDKQKNIKESSRWADFGLQTGPVVAVRLVLGLAQ